MCSILGTIRYLVYGSRGYIYNIWYFCYCCSLDNSLEGGLAIDLKVSKQGTFALAKVKLGIVAKQSKDLQLID